MPVCAVSPFRIASVSSVPVGRWTIGFESGREPECPRRYLPTQLVGNNPVLYAPFATRCPVSSPLRPTSKPRCLKLDAPAVTTIEKN